MEGCMSGFMGSGQVNLCEGLSQLKSEHPPLLKKLEELLSLSLKVENNEDPSFHFQALHESVEVFIRELGPHSEREEGVLFEMMGAYIGRESGPIAVMEYEHDQAKSLIGRFLERTENGLDDISEVEMRELSAMIKQANYTLVDHFSKEENVLFPMAERMLNESEKAQLAARIKEI
ncbi:hemerythrin domain-containing protein [Mesobacillus harenae]|uniref:hemerythrin domain-containing protein n=1 Tax=Mesobacillus harenae TaxID=2213203 RepID=UPI001F553486|nr:hemerythrin domain-containing protein [Mesobacillus harenae]